MNESLNEKLSRIIYGSIKVITNITVILISTLLTTNLFMSFSDDPMLKLIWLVAGIAVEMGAVFCLVRAKAYFKAGDRKNAFKYLPAYIGLALISLIAGAGFALNSISIQSDKAEVVNSVSDSILITTQISQLQEEVEELKINREEVRVLKNSYPENWYTKKANAQIKIDDYTEVIGEKNDKINELNLLKSETVNNNEIAVVKSSDIFTSLGNGWISGTRVMLYLMLFFSFMIEVLKVVTSGDYPIKDISKEEAVVGKEEEKPVEAKPTIVEENIIPEPKNTFQMNVDREEMFKYIDALMANGREKLVQDQVIAENTKIPLARCKRYRHQLLNMKYDSRPIVVSKRGVGSHANFPKKTIFKLLEIQDKLSIS